jgi:hypothetical protein
MIRIARKLQASNPTGQINNYFGNFGGTDGISRSGKK